MSDSSFRSGVGLAALLLSVVGAYALVLGGVTPLPGDASYLLAALAAAATACAAAMGERVPAAFAAVATAGFAGGALASGFAVTVAAALAAVGGIGFVLAACWRTRERVSGAAAG